MNNNNNGQIEVAINIREIIWDLLEQWKAVLISALLMAVLISGAKYAKDMKAFKVSQTEKEAEKQNTVSAEERIEDVLAALPESERSTVVTIVNQNEWIATQEEYVNNSILLNTDPTNQRTLVVDYYITASDDSDVLRSSLIYGYSAFLRNKDVNRELREFIAPNAKDGYIAELITVENLDGNKDAQSTDAVMEVRIVLPENADSAKVEEVLTSILQGGSSNLSGKIGQHYLSLLDVSEIYLYNGNAVNNRTNILYSINNLKNNTKNMKANLSDGQKAAIETITTIKTTEAIATDVGAAAEEDDAASVKPGISKKYALLGFVLGVMLYAFAYLLIVIKRGCLTGSDDASLYTRTRLLGELYEQTELSGIRRLLKSRIVDKYRYGNRLDKQKQVEKIRTSIEAVCRHAGVKELTLFDFSCSENLKYMITKEIKKLGIKVSEMTAGEEINENALCDVANAVFLTGNMTKASALCSLTELLADYDIRAFGSIYAAEI